MSKTVRFDLPPDAADKVKSGFAHVPEQAKEM